MSKRGRKKQKYNKKSNKYFPINEEYSYKEVERPQKKKFKNDADVVIPQMSSNIQPLEITKTDDRIDTYIDPYKIILSKLNKSIKHLNNSNENITIDKKDLGFVLDALYLLLNNATKSGIITDDNKNNASLAAEYIIEVING